MTNNNDNDNKNNIIGSATTKDKKNNIVSYTVVVEDGTIKNIYRKIDYDEVFEQKVKLNKIGDLNGYKDYLEKKMKKESINIGTKAAGAFASSFLAIYGLKQVNKAAYLLNNYGDSSLGKAGAVIVGGSGCAVFLIYAKMILCGDLNFDIRPAVKARKEYKEELLNTQKDIVTINHVHSIRKGVERDFYTELKVTVGKCQMLPEEIKKRFFTLIRKIVKSFNEGINRLDVRSDSYGSELDSILDKAKNNLLQMNSTADDLAIFFSNHQDVDFDNIINEKLDPVFEKGIKL